MYEERKESFSVRSLILQILFVVLTVFLLLWLFPTKNYVKDYAMMHLQKNYNLYIIRYIIKILLQ